MNKRLEVEEMSGKLTKKEEKKIEKLIKKLKDENWEVRRSAAEALGEMGEKAVPALIEALKDEAVRFEAALALRVMGEKAEKAVPALIEALKDEAVNVRVGAALALTEMGEKAEKAVPALVEALKDEAKRVRLRAAEALAAMGEKAVPSLKEAIKSDKKIVREQAIIALETISAKLGYHNHQEYLRASMSEEERRAETIGEYIEQLDSLNLQKRKVAAYKLGELQAAEAIEPLGKLLDKRRENTWLRAFAVWALGEIGSDKAIRTLKIIEKPKPLVGYVIKGALVKLDEEYQNEISIEEGKKRTKKERERIEDCQRQLKEEYDGIILSEPRESWWGRLKPAVRELIKGALSALLGALIGGVIGWLL